MAEWRRRARIYVVALAISLGGFGWLSYAMRILPPGECDFDCPIGYGYPFVFVWITPLRHHLAWAGDGFVEVGCACILALILGSGWLARFKS